MSALQTRNPVRSAVRPACNARTLRPFTSRKIAVRVSAAALSENDELGFKTMRDGIKVAADETILTPRFYTTDFDEISDLYSLEKNPNLPMEELEACHAEFKNDYNQRHFVRNNTFKPAADAIHGSTRKIFVEFLERSCTAEFSGFLLYKELGRRMKTSNPCIADQMTMMSRDEARHAGFLNKALTDFNLALDLGFLTKNRKYTFFKPKFILYATYLSEKIGYWRYICIYRHLQANPDCQLYPLFEYFENWCQDECRHGDFLAAMLKAKPELLQGLAARLWCRFFCLSVYVTMYLNDHGRSYFYETLGMNTKKFNQHVILETNKSSERCFPEVPDVENPEFFPKMDRLVELSTMLSNISKMNVPGPVKAVMELPIKERMFALLVQLYLMNPKQTGSFDLESSQTALQY